jgi:hypothetical protein
MPYVAINFFKIIKYWKNEVGFGSFAIFPNYRKDKEIFRSVGKFCLMKNLNYMILWLNNNCTETCWSCCTVRCTTFCDITTALSG